MKNPMKSLTLQGLVLLLLSSMPGLSAPLWDVILDAGVSGPWVARLKLAAYALGVAGIVWGRVRAKQPLGIR